MATIVEFPHIYQREGKKMYTFGNEKCQKAVINTLKRCKDARYHVTGNTVILFSPSALLITLMPLTLHRYSNIDYTTTDVLPGEELATAIAQANERLQHPITYQS